MEQSRIVLKNGNPRLCFGGEELSPCAYITYFEERNDYAAFASRGFRVYSVSLATASQPINSGSGFTPHFGGVFDRKGEADFSEVDRAIGLILQSCPNACIFPRIYVCMPQWWIDENPAETIAVPRGKRRESLYSAVFRRDAAQMLDVLIRHFRERWGKHIFGYQISGGNTQEWFHLDLHGGYDATTLPYFNQWLAQHAPTLYPAETMPDLSGLEKTMQITDPLLSAYLRFASEAVTETVEGLCKAAKKAANNEQIVGVFYGYTAEVTDWGWGTHALGKLLNSPYIDFFSSPNSYMDSRALGVDWPDMMPADSVQLHGKMCFLECDIRTFLTLAPEDSRPGSDPDRYYSAAVWAGPPTEELSAWAMRKSLARQLTHKHGLWWFDMFGHWYDAPMLLTEAARSLVLYDNVGAEDACEFPVEVALFYDETAYAEIGRANPVLHSAHTIRKSLGASGVPYHVYLLSDLENIDWANSSYKAVVFGSARTEALAAKADALLAERGIASIAVSSEKPFYTAEELAAFFEAQGVFSYCDAGDVLYVGNGFAALHAASAGEKTIRLPQTVRTIDTESGTEQTTDTLQLTCKQHETRFFCLKK